MTTKHLVYYVLYGLLLWFTEKYPTIRLLWWYPLAVKEMFPLWVETKTMMTMADVDRQLESIDVGPSGVPDPVFTEKVSGIEGFPEMRLSAPWSISAEKSEEVT